MQKKVEYASRRKRDWIFQGRSEVSKGKKYQREDEGEGSRREIEHNGPYYMVCLFSTRIKKGKTDNNFRLESAGRGGTRGGEEKNFIILFSLLDETWGKGGSIKKGTD